jgi:hypothetical protein
MPCLCWLSSRTGPCTDYALGSPSGCSLTVSTPARNGPFQLLQNLSHHTVCRLPRDIPPEWASVGGSSWDQHLPFCYHCVLSILGLTRVATPWSQAYPGSYIKMLVRNSDSESYTRMAQGLGICFSTDFSGNKVLPRSRETQRLSLPQTV